ncbi:DUF1622 domain-containing protein [Microbacterium sp. bgisy203]|uniref:DUF1622 domain-containing protein n=1 Tax=Microbacterium sp. bgisy203 TaxID=3413799 RepID=UPI003D757DC0
MTIEPVFTGVAVTFEVVGVVAIVVGFAVAIVLAALELARGHGGGAAYLTLRRTLGGAILLGLEILVAADLIRTITSKPSIEEALVLGIVVLIRTILSLSIQIEIDGVLPWRRALLTSGAQVMSREIGSARRGGRAYGGRADAAGRES